MTTQSRLSAPLPEIGRPESYYARLAQEADKAADPHSHEAAKVAQYITLAIDPNISWDEKLKYFRHALKRHCVAPPFPDEDVWMFYNRLAAWVRQHAGQEALRLASTEDDMYAARLSFGTARDQIENEAETFFAKLIGEGDQCPDWITEEDWGQLKLIRDQWI